MSARFDILIVGGGPAGISAALTAVNRGKTVGVVANPPETSKLYLAESITNYPGMEGSGAQIMRKMRSQLEESSATVIPGKALSVMSLGKSIGVAVGNNFFDALSVIIATGISRRPLCEGETKFLGRGVSYCATCDGMLYRGKKVAVLGEGEEAEKDIAFLREIGCEVSVFSGRGKIEILGDNKADTLIVNGETVKTDCIFILKETLSAESLVNGIESERGIIKVGLSGKTNINGVFAAGDCTGAPYQLAKAVGEGNIAALAAVDYISKL